MALPKRVFNHTSTARENTNTLALLFDSNRTQAGRFSQSGQRTQTDKRTYSYIDCVMGIAPVPHDYFGGSVFKLLMAGGMTTVMVTFNSIIHSGVGFVLESIWMYPLILCLSLGMRFLYADRVVDRIAPRYILPKFKGFTRNLIMTLLNVSLMAPIMGFIAALLLAGPDGFIDRMASTMPYSIPVSILVNLFIVGPIVRMLYHNVLAASTENKMFEMTQHYVTNWAGVFTS